MNTRTSLFALACAIALCPALQSQTINSQSGAKKGSSSAKTEKRTVKQLDGTKQFGFVEITDDYTIRVSNDSGIIRTPIAELGDADFRKYGFKKDRSKDGRFWYEWKEALKELKDPKSKNEAKSGEKSTVEIRLAEISAFQPFIATYEKTLPPKESANRPGDSSQSSNVPFRPMFSQPTVGNPLPKTLSHSGYSGSNRSQLQLNCRRRHDCEFLARKPDQGTRRLYSTSRADKSSPCWLCRSIP